MKATVQLHSIGGCGAASDSLPVNLFPSSTSSCKPTLYGNWPAIPGSTKFFATETLEQFRRDEKWLARASDAIASYWRERNARKQKARGRA